MSERHGSGDPAQAFEDLRAEVSVLRKAIEVLPDALERNRAPDYSPDFAVIGQGMDAIGAALENLQKHPALRLTPEQHGSAVAQAGMRGSKWDAGMALMKAGNPDGWAQLTADANLVSANRSKITDCRATAAKEKREQRCPVIIPGP